MQNNNMTLQRFEELIGTYGAKENLWPDDERAQMQAVASDPAAKDIIAKALLVDAMLDTQPEPKPASDELLNRLSKMPPPKANVKNVNAPALSNGFLKSFGFYGFFPRAVGLASICALGIIVGLSDVARGHKNVVTLDANTILFDSSYVERDLKDLN